MKVVNHQNVCDNFIQEMQAIQGYIDKCKSVFSENDKYLSFSYENAVIMLYKSFETFILRIMISCLNHNHSHFEEKYGIKLGNHINDDVCEFLITKGGFFDFQGRSGLNKALNSTIGTNHPIGLTIKKTDYSNTINQLCTVRNYAAHNSKQAKQKVQNAYNKQRVSTAGSFLKKQNRFSELVVGLTALANDVKRIPMP